MLRALIPLLLFSALARAETVSELLKSVQATNFVERLEKFSEKFLGTPYVALPLGEGADARFDQGPAYRFDSFDCTTFVETVTALALSNRPPEFESWLRKIRYWKGKVDYLNRNHFACGDWVPNNSAWGLLTDITESLAGPEGTRTAAAVEDKRGWVDLLPKETIRVAGITLEERDRRLAELRKQAALFRPRKVELKFMPLDAVLTKAPVVDDEKKRRAAEEDKLIDTLWEKSSLQAGGDADSDGKLPKEVFDLRLKYLIKDVQVDSAFLAKIPSGSLITVVRPNLSIPGTRLLISHQGFVFRKGDTPYFRHSSRSGGARTKDVPLANYLRLCLLSPAIHGIQIFRVNDVRAAAAATVSRVQSKHRVAPFLK